VTATAILGELPALPLHTAGKYVAGAYVVLFALVLIYVAIMAVRLGRAERELGELLELAERPRTRNTPDPQESELAVGRAHAVAAADAQDLGRPQSTAVGAPSE
jgi:hypothetical protein